MQRQFDIITDSCCGMPREFYEEHRHNRNPARLYAGRGQLRRRGGKGAPPSKSFTPACARAPNAIPFRSPPNRCAPSSKNSFRGGQGRARRRLFLRPLGHRVLLFGGGVLPRRRIPRKAGARTRFHGRIDGRGTARRIPAAKGGRRRLSRRNVRLRRDPQTAYPAPVHGGRSRISQKGRAHLPRRRGRRETPQNQAPPARHPQGHARPHRQNRGQKTVSWKRSPTKRCAAPSFRTPIPYSSPTGTAKRDAKRMEALLRETIRAKPPHPDQLHGSRHGRPRRPPAFSPSSSRESCGNDPSAGPRIGIICFFQTAKNERFSARFFVHLLPGSAKFAEHRQRDAGSFPFGRNITHADGVHFLKAERAIEGRRFPFGVQHDAHIAAVASERFRDEFFSPCPAPESRERREDNGIYAVISPSSMAARSPTSRSPSQAEKTAENPFIALSSLSGYFADSHLTEENSSFSCAAGISFVSEYRSIYDLFFSIQYVRFSLRPCTRAKRFSPSAIFADLRLIPSVSLRSTPPLSKRGGMGGRRDTFPFPKGEAFFIMAPLCKGSRHAEHD